MKSLVFLIVMTFLCFLGLAKLSENKNSKWWVIAGIVVLIFELLLVFNFFELIINKL